MQKKYLDSEQTNEQTHRNPSWNQSKLYSTYSSYKINYYIQHIKGIGAFPCEMDIEKIIAENYRNAIGRK